ncbi:unnamed protein product [Brachionus calyciflorus]|uniref:DGCR14 n=1 Tax=Brachionus calyciflorus TaxID=104777 RepID=A0A813TWK2_9BILA|nr:unnamed protein product [Brachionus calyciflorus]
MSLVTKTSDDQLKLELKKDEPKPKRKVNVLDEETYIKKLETIIEKSFFPDLERLKIQQAYHEALKTNDFNTLRDLYEKYNKLLSSSSKSVKSTPSSTPAYFDTPAKKSSEEPYANEEPPEISTENTKEQTVIESLDKFLAKNTSEDNISFENLIEESDKKQKTKIHQAWLFEKEKLHQLKSEQSLMLEGPVVDDEIIKSLDTWKYTSKNSLMYVPEGVPLTHEEELANCKSARIINHSNTRFSKESLNKLNTVVSILTPSSNKPINPLANPIVKLDVEGKEAKPKETPKIRGYSLVEPSPSPMPGRLAGDESPMMIWGEIEGTPLRLEQHTPYTPRLSGGPEFKIPDIPEREKIALQLEEKMSAEKRKKKQEALKQVQRSIASPSRNLCLSPSVTDKINSMSPAAQRLLTSKKKNDPIFSSPLVRSPSAKSPYFGIVSPRIKTPDTNSQQMNDLKTSLKRTVDSSLTDNLLKLPKTS